MSRRRHISLQPDDGENRVEVNISPLVDVVFLLLVFFVLSGTLMREHQLPVQMPQAHGRTTRVQNAGKIVNVSADGRIFLDGRQTDMDRISKLTEQGALTECAIRIDREAPAGVLVELLSVLPPTGIRVLPPD